MSGRIDIGEYLREHRERGEILLRGKWAMDGAESLDEAAHMLRAFADELEALASAGFHLMGPFEDDHGFAHRGDERGTEERRPRTAMHHLNEVEAGPGLRACATGPCSAAQVDAHPVVRAVELDLG